MSEYRTLRNDAIIKTTEILRNRVQERFPARGLGEVSAELLDLSRQCAVEATELGRPNWWLRIVATMTIAAGAYGFYILSGFYEIFFGGQITLGEFTQGLEASLNILLICALIIIFFATLENRYKRLRALRGLHKLRSISHVIDMHQLTKDPEAIVGTDRTLSSPRRDLTPTQLLRYLDYCAEMLSVIGKLAALYAQNFPDATVISAVNDIETLTTNLSRKIWQKITIMQQPRTAGPTPQALAVPALD